MKKTRWLSLFTAGVRRWLVELAVFRRRDRVPRMSSSSQTEESSQVTETKVPTLYIGTYDRRGTAVSRSSRL